jgi:hypothetical protein
MDRSSDAIYDIDAGGDNSHHGEDDLSLSTSMVIPFEEPIQQLEDPLEISMNTFLDSRILGYSRPDWQDFLASTPGSQVFLEPRLTETRDSHFLRFLDGMTSKTGFIHSFDCGTLKQREDALLMLELEAQYNLLQPTRSSPVAVSESEHNSLGPSELSNIETITSTMEVQSQAWLDDPLFLKTHEILLLVKEVVMVKPRNSAVNLNWSSALEQECLQFFAPSNLRKFLGLYWAIWHPNVNFVHRPTFDPISAKPTILAAMTLIGMSYSSIV